MHKYWLLCLITTFSFNLNCLFAASTNFSSFEKLDSLPKIFLDSIFLKSNRHYDFFIAPLSELPLFNPIDGFLLETKIGARINLNKPISLSFKPRYALQRKLFYAEAEISVYLVKNQRFSTLFKLSGGNFLNQVNEPFSKNERIFSILNLLKGNNPLLFIERKFWKIQIKQTFFTHFSLLATTEFADRSYLDNYHFKDFNFAPNKPLGYFNLKDKSLLQSFDFSYNPFFTISYKKGIKGFMKSESDFDFVQLELSHSIKLNKMARLDLSFFSGSFLKQNFIHFNDHYHFPTGRTLKSNNPVISTFRLLDYYAFSTNNYFHRIHFQFQSGDFLLSRFPSLRRGKILENLFINMAVTDKLNPFIEIGYALDHVFKKFRLEIVTGRLDGKWLGPRIILGPVSL